MDSRKQWQLPDEHQQRKYVLVALDEWSPFEAFVMNVWWAALELEVGPLIEEAVVLQALKIKKIIRNDHEIQVNTLIIDLPETTGLTILVTVSTG